MRVILVNEIEHEIITMALDDFVKSAKFEVAMKKLNGKLPLLALTDADRFTKFWTSVKYARKAVANA